MSDLILIRTRATC